MITRAHRMRVVLVVSFVSLLVGLSPGDVAEASPGPRVTICHFPPGDPAGVHLVTVGAPIARAHVNNHNDAICPAGATDCCFDGHTPSACTNLQTDVNNCGICGHVCANTESCDRGVCTLSLYPPLRCRSGCTTAPIRTVVAFSRCWCTYVRKTIPLAPPAARPRSYRVSTDTKSIRSCSRCRHLTAAQE